MNCVAFFFKENENIQVGPEVFGHSYHNFVFYQTAMDMK